MRDLLIIEKQNKRDINMCPRYQNSISVQNLINGTGTNREYVVLIQILYLR